jgi:hypothetical protein
MKPPRAYDEKPAPSKPPMQHEEKKRGGWGNQGPRSNSNNGKGSAHPGSRAPAMKKQQSTNDGEDMPESIGSPENKKKKKDDWNYLK